MIQDKKLMFSDSQELRSTADSTNILDLGAHGDDIQRELTLFVQFRGAVDSAGESTLIIQLNTDDALNAGGDDLAADNTLWTSASIAKTDLTDGAMLVKMPLPPGIQRYLRLKYTVGTANLTAGAIDAGLVWGIDQP